MDQERCPRCGGTKIEHRMTSVNPSVIHTCERCDYSWGDVNGYMSAMAEVRKQETTPKPSAVPAIDLVYGANGSVMWPGVITILR